MRSRPGRSRWRNLERIPERPAQQTDFFNDVQNGKLRAGCASSSGRSWVASLVNAIGESQYWGSTAIFIFWVTSNTSRSTGVRSTANK